MLDTIKFKARRRSKEKEWLFSESFQKMPVLGGFLVMLWIVGEGWVEIDSNTVCIFSGRFDKDGNELYSGDKISEHNEITFSITNGFSINGDRPLWMFRSEDISMIGNVHD